MTDRGQHAKWSRCVVQRALACTMIDLPTTGRPSTAIILALLFIILAIASVLTILFIHFNVIYIYVFNYGLFGFIFF